MYVNLACCKRPCWIWLGRGGARAASRQLLRPIAVLRAIDTVQKHTGAVKSACCAATILGWWLQKHPGRAAAVLPAWALVWRGARVSGCCCCWQPAPCHCCSAEAIKRGNRTQMVLQPRVAQTCMQQGLLAIYAAHRWPSSLRARCRQCCWWRRGRHCQVRRQRWIWTVQNCVRCEFVCRMLLMALLHSSGPRHLACLRKLLWSSKCTLLCHSQWLAPHQTCLL